MTHEFILRVDSLYEVKQTDLLRALLSTQALSAEVEHIEISALHKSEITKAEKPEQ